MTYLHTYCFSSESLLRGWWAEVSFLFCSKLCVCPLHRAMTCVLSGREWGEWLPFGPLTLVLMDTTGLSHSHGQTPHQAAIVCLSFCKVVVSSKEQLLLWHSESWESSKIVRFHYWESVLLTLVEKAVQTTPWKVSACLPQRECPVWHGLSVLCLLCSQNVFRLSHFSAGISWLLKQFI